MTKEETSAITNEVVKMNVSVKEAIELCKRQEGATYESKMDRGTINIS